MGNLNRKAIYCPKREEHAHPKFLLLIGDGKVTVNCHEHQWIDIEFYDGDELIDLSNATVKLKDVPKGTMFDTEVMPAIAIGQFKTKKKRVYAHN